MSIADSVVIGKFEKASLECQIRDVSKYRVHYWDSERDKPAIVLVHGFGAPTRFQWYKQLNELKADYRIIVPNLLYFGESRPIEGNHYELEHQVEMLLALLDDLKVDEFTLCGVSYGGLISAELARKVPDRIRKLILFDAPVKFFTQQDIDTICSRYQVPHLADLFVPNNHRGLRDLMGLAFYHPPKIPAFLLKGTYDQLYKPNHNHLRQLINDIIADPDRFTNTEYKFPFPTLLIWGSADDVIPVRIAKELKDHMNDCRLEIIPKTRHMPNLEEPKVFNELLISFLSEGL